VTKQNTSTFIRGYVEGYYGKLLTFRERLEITQCLSSLGLNTFCYAPKEDPQHRLNWRESHSSQWHKSFADFCTDARGMDVSVIAGIAPGLDFQFNTQANSPDTSTDFDHLQRKTQQYLQAGATEILILWDDIDDNFNQKISISEGTAHARTVNQLSDALGRPLWTVPRVYANEIENKDNYLEDFFTELKPQHTVLLCGKAIVASSVQYSDLTQLGKNTTDKPQSLKHRTVVWDNFYANDYCPRRLFIGPWTGRTDINEYLINPTGLPFTDKLIMEIVSATHGVQHSTEAWHKVLKRHGVPDAFLHIADYFLQPCFGDHQATVQPDCALPTAEVEQAIEECLWRWKSPLAREWYPFIMSLKHDLALMQNILATDRILKTQTPGLAKRLLL